ncbi:MAG: hypothetical protein WEF86_06240 [Gemmatimonadota bacterium]
MKRHAVAIGVLLFHALIFVLLSADIMVRVWDWRGRFETPLDAAALLFFEGLRCVVTLTGIAMTVFILRRARSSPSLLRLAYALALTTIACTKLYGYDGFPGALQERAAISLLAHGTPRWLLQVVFGQWQWAAWLAAASFVLVAAAWPRRLTPADVHAGGARDRAGAMRSVAVAGADVGSLVRSLTAYLVRGGWLEPRRVLAVVGAAAVVHTALLFMADGAARTAVNVAAVVAGGAVAGICVTMFRAGWNAADEADRPFLVWLRRAALSALALFASSSAAAVAGAAFLSTAALSLAPAAAFLCIAAAGAHYTTN